MIQLKAKLGYPKMHNLANYLMLLNLLTEIGMESLINKI